MTNQIPPDALKPCPFCGGDAMLHDNNFFQSVTWHVECTECMADLPGGSNKQEAINDWNTRYIPPTTLS